MTDEKPDLGDPSVKYVMCMFLAVGTAVAPGSTVTACHYCNQGVVVSKPGVTLLNQGAIAVCPKCVSEYASDDDVGTVTDEMREALHEMGISDEEIDARNTESPKALAERLVVHHERTSLN